MSRLKSTATTAAADSAGARNGKMIAKVRSDSGFIMGMN
jgi:hypothetical protein